MFNVHCLFAVMQVIESFQASSGHGELTRPGPPIMTVGRGTHVELDTVDLGEEHRDTSFILHTTLGGFRKSRTRRGFPCLEANSQDICEGKTMPALLP